MLLFFTTTIYHLNHLIKTKFEFFDEPYFTFRLFEFKLFTYLIINLKAKLDYGETKLNFVLKKFQNIDSDFIFTSDKIHIKQIISKIRDKGFNSLKQKVKRLDLTLTLRDQSILYYKQKGFLNQPKSLFKIGH
ncbi:hypothetical protein BpHYR1_005393 [Brachionus plicatilis]|uniref:Uncharacterized protein n=1 Tax=Brachionus plicatilis TaxID=10195 RepID=A0A3M7R0B6_BRAPC|nr:hypothetical protein BpHYR1_005393 [Brachionus plicatilis]